MKNITRPAPRQAPRQASHQAPHQAPLVSATELARDITRHHALVLSTLTAIAHHPRSLARPQGHWRPPRFDLPAITGRPHTEGLCLALTRYRVGQAVKNHLRLSGHTGVPAYLISLRLSNRQGLPLYPQVTEAWIRALVPPEDITAVHEITSPTATTFVWLVDASFRPIASPESLFNSFDQAA